MVVIKSMGPKEDQKKDPKDSLTIAITEKLTANIKKFMFFGTVAALYWMLNTGILYYDEGALFLLNFINLALMSDRIKMLKIARACVAVFVAIVTIHLSYEQVWCQYRNLLFEDECSETMEFQFPALDLNSDRYPIKVFYEMARALLIMLVSISSLILPVLTLSNIIREKFSDSKIKDLVVAAIGKV